MYAQQPTKSKFRVTFEFDVFDDFDPYNINWDKLFDIEGQEFTVHVEDIFVSIISPRTFFYGILRKSRISP